MKCCNIFSVTVKSAITPSFSGRMAWMLPGVRPSMLFAALPTAAMLLPLPCPRPCRMATTDGSLRTIPVPRAYTRVFAVPRSIERSLENRPLRRLNMNDPIPRVGYQRQELPSIIGFPLIHGGRCRIP